MGAVAASRPGETPEPFRLPSIARRAVIYATLAVILGGAIYAIVIDAPYADEPWPFSAYPMYSELRRNRAVERHRLFGVTREEPAREIPLVDPVFLYPLEHSRFYFTLGRLERRGDGRRSLETAMRDTLERYEARRRAGLHDGPPLRGIRLYELRWRLDPLARNRDTPDQRRILFEVSSP
jgi:hypothetical protein